MCHSKLLIKDPIKRLRTQKDLKSSSIITKLQQLNTENQQQFRRPN